MGYLRRSRCRRIFARGRRRDVPVLVISALDRVATLSRILGAEGFLRKPFTAEELIDAVQRAREAGPAKNLV